MITNLISQLERVEIEYKKSIELVNEIFDFIKKDEITKLPDANKKQLDCMNVLKEEKENLKAFVKEVAEKNGIDEFRVQHILHLYGQVEKEAIIDKQKQLMQLEEELRMGLLRNGSFLSAVLSSKEARIDAIIQLNEAQNKESNLFLNKKF